VNPLSRVLRRLLRDRRGSADLNTYLLLTAAGCTMVGLTAPHLFKSSKTASDTFEKQVEILQRGAGGGASGGSGAGAGGGDWNLGGQGGLGQLAGSLGGAGAQLSGNGGQLANGGGQLANAGGQLAGAGGQLANGGGQLANAGGPTVTAAAAGGELAGGKPAKAKNPVK
jgi:hypothetical protein